VQRRRDRLHHERVERPPRLATRVERRRWANVFHRRRRPRDESRRLHPHGGPTAMTRGDLPWPHAASIGFRGPRNSARRLSTRAGSMHVRAARTVINARQAGSTPPSRLVRRPLWLRSASPRVALALLRDQSTSTHVSLHFTPLHRPPRFGSDRRFKAQGRTSPRRRRAAAPHPNLTRTSYLARNSTQTAES
jgi:hypothetical protein